MHITKHSVYQGWGSTVYFYLVSSREDILLLISEREEGREERGERQTDRHRPDIKPET